MSKSKGRITPDERARRLAREFVDKMRDNAAIADESLAYWATRKERWGRSFPKDEATAAKIHESYHAGWVDCFNSMRVLLEDQVMAHFGLEE